MEREAYGNVAVLTDSDKVVSLLFRVVSSTDAEVQTLLSQIITHFDSMAMQMNATMDEHSEKFPESSAYKGWVLDGIVLRIYGDEEDGLDSSNSIWIHLIPTYW